MTSPYQKHRAKWINCKCCLLHKCRNRVVLARGMIPAPILFIGEAPGASEDVIGQPFVGPAGKLLDKIIEQGIDGQADYCITNLVGCIPKENGSKSGEPSEEAIRACRPRLNEFVQLCKPKVIVCVGKLAEKHAWGIGYQLADEKVVSIIHPAAILRMDPSQKGLAVQRSVVVLSDVVDSLDVPF